MQNLESTEAQRDVPVVSTSKFCTFIGESAGEIRCNALDAYVPKNLVCRDKDDEPDRIVCPDDFYRSVSDLSPASGAQKCGKEMVLVTSSFHFEKHSPLNIS